MAKIFPLKDGTKKDVITKKAAALFRQKGFHSTSMRSIAEAIGIEAPSLYNYITSKNEILKDICFYVADQFNAQLEKIEADKGNSITKIEEIIRFHISITIHDFERIYISNHEWKHLSNPFLNEYKSLRRSYQQRFAAIVQKGINKKEIRNIDADLAVLTILSSINGIEAWQKSGKKIDKKIAEKNLVTILIEGLRKN